MTRDAEISNECELLLICWFDVELIDESIGFVPPLFLNPVPMLLSVYGDRAYDQLAATENSTFDKNR